MILGWLSSTLAVIVFAIATLAGVITIVVTKKEREKASFVLPKLEHILDGKPLPSDISSTNECHNSDNHPEEPQADSFPQRKSHGIEDDPKSGDTEYKSSNPFAGMFSSSEEEKSEASYNDTDTAQLMSIKSSKSSSFPVFLNCSRESREVPEFIVPTLIEKNTNFFG